MTDPVGPRAHEDVIWTHVACPLCGADDPEGLVTDVVVRGGLAHVFPVVRCARCGMVYVTPRGHGEAFGAEVGGSARTDASVANREVYRTGVARLVAAGLRPGARVLDLGCAQGAFLAFAEEAGFEAVGVDVNARLAQTARDRGFSVHVGDLRELGLDAQFDAVTMWDVIEHVDDPIAVLQACHDVLRPEGFLLFHTGNARFQIPKARLLSAVRPRGGPYLIPYQHLTHFDPATSARVLERAGFWPLDVFFAGTLHYRAAHKRLAMRTVNALGRVPPYFGGPLLTNALAAIGQRPAD